jgi:2,4-dienoyl-CoA reductase-like NADH-dependent reductase (Old Yellow Enzyme family)
MPRPLSLEEIEELALSFVSAAQRAHEAGFDLLCLHMAHGYLLHQFITPLANQREDRYGGDEEGRLRLPLEVIKGIRKRLGSRAVISVRISSEDGVEGGLKIEDTSRIAQKLIGAGADLLDVSYGFPGSIPSSSPSRDFPDGCFIPLAEKIKKATGAPVVAVGKIRSLALAEQVLREKRADLVALSRPLLADPELPRKWREGREEEVRRCTADNKGCLERIHQNLEVRCSVNPTLGRTSERQR